jgi:hypothetical protein
LCKPINWHSWFVMICTVKIDQLDVLLFCNKGMVKKRTRCRLLRLTLTGSVCVSADWSWKWGMQRWACSCTLYNLTHIKRQATQHGCLPSLRAIGTNEFEQFYGEEKIFCIGPTRAAKAEQTYLVPARHAQQTNHGRIPESLSFVLFESPITSVSTDSRALYRKSDFCIPRNETAWPYDLIPNSYINVYVNSWYIPG